MNNPLNSDLVLSLAMKFVAKGLTAKECNQRLPELDAMNSQEARYEAAAMRCAMRLSCHKA